MQSVHLWLQQVPFAAAQLVRCARWLQSQRSQIAVVELRRLLRCGWTARAGLSSTSFLPRGGPSTLAARSSPTGVSAHALHSVELSVLH